MFDTIFEIYNQFIPESHFHPDQFHDSHHHTTSFVGPRDIHSGPMMPQPPQLPIPLRLKLGKLPEIDSIQPPVDARGHALPPKINRDTIPVKRPVAVPSRFLTYPLPPNGVM